MEKNHFEFEIIARIDAVENRALRIGLCRVLQDVRLRQFGACSI
jgi:hypothetical protein